MEVSVYVWAGFIVFVLAMLALDLGVFNRKSHAISMKEAGIWTAVWISLALIFNVAIYFWQGRTAALEFLTGYLIEKALSVDNLFVFALIFTMFAVPAKFQHRVLFWGVLGALLMRGVFIGAGAALLDRFHWLIYVMGAFLVFTGIKLAVQKETAVHPDRNPLVKLASKIMPVTKEYHGERFFVRLNGVTRRDAAVPGPARGREHRRGVCGGLHPGDLCRDARPVPGLHLQRIRDPRLAIALLPARRRARINSITSSRHWR